MRFREAGYWDIEGDLREGGPGRAAGRHPASRSTASASPRGRDFDPETGTLTRDVLQLDEAAARSLAERLETRDLRGALGRGQALHPQAVRAVHDHHPAAGGRPQAPDDRAAGDADRAAAVRERLHHLHAHRQHQPVGDRDHRRAPAGPRPLRPGVRPGRAPHATPRRSRTRRRRTRPSAPPATSSGRPGELAARGARRRAPALRADLAAHRRLADGRRPRASPPASGSARSPPTAPTPSSPPPARPSPSRASCGPTSRAATTPTPSCERPSGGCPASRSARRSPSAAWSRSGHTTTPAGALHRGVAGQAARGARHRPARRPTPRSSRPSRTAATSGRRARRSSRPGWRSRSSACSSSTSAGSSTTASPRRWRTTSTRSPTATATASTG